MFLGCVTGLESQDFSDLVLKPSISSHSKPHMMACTSYDGLYEASQMFCFTTQCNQNKTFKSLVQGAVRGFEWVEILGLSCLLPPIVVYKWLWHITYFFVIWLIGFHMNGSAMSLSCCDAKHSSFIDTNQWCHQFFHQRRANIYVTSQAESPICSRQN